MSAASERNHSWSLRASLQADATGVLLIVAGRLGTAAAPELRSALDAATSAGGHVRLDLADVDYISSAGLAVLDDAAQRLRAAGGELKVVRASEAVSLALRLTGNLEVRTQKSEFRGQSSTSDF